MRILLTSLLILCFSCSQESKETAINQVQEPINVVKEEIVEALTILKAEDQTDYDAERWSSYDYRDKNWQPERGKYFFSESWTWRYENQFAPKDEFGHKGKMSIYVDPATGTMLFKNKDAGLSDDMTDAVLTFANGKVIVCFKDEFGKKKRYESESNAEKMWRDKRADVLKEFQESMTKTGKEKVFGENKYGWPTILAQEYKMTFAKTREQSTMYIAPVPIKLHALYLINKITNDLRAPFNISYQNVLPENYLVLEETFEQNGKKYEFVLESMSNTEEHFDINSYETLGKE